MFVPGTQLTITRGLTQNLLYICISLHHCFGATMFDFGHPSLYFSSYKKKEKDNRVVTRDGRDEKCTKSTMCSVVLILTFSRFQWMIEWWDKCRTFIKHDPLFSVNLKLVFLNSNLAGIPYNKTPYDWRSSHRSHGILNIGFKPKRHLIYGKGRFFFILKRVILHILSLWRLATNFVGT